MNVHWESLGFSETGRRLGLRDSFSGTCLQVGSYEVAGNFMRLQVHRRLVARWAVLQPSQNPSPSLGTVDFQKRSCLSLRNYIISKNNMAPVNQRDTVLTGEAPQETGTVWGGRGCLRSWIIREGLRKTLVGVEPEMPSTGGNRWW